MIIFMSFRLDLLVHLLSVTKLHQRTICGLNHNRILVIIYIGNDTFQMAVGYGVPGLIVSLGLIGKNYIFKLQF
jgi:hypothetical protein